MGNALEYLELPNRDWFGLRNVALLNLTGMTSQGATQPVRKTPRHVKKQWGGEEEPWLAAGTPVASPLQCAVRRTEVCNYYLQTRCPEQGLLHGQCSINKYLLNESKSTEKNWSEEQVLGHMK